MDYTFVVDPYPPLDDKADALSFSRQGGGPVPNALCALSRFGVSCGFIGKCGNDPDGQSIREELESFGVNASRLVLDPNSRTPRAFILVEKKSGKRTVVLDRTQSSALAPEEIDPVLLQGIRFLLIDGREPDSMLTAAILVKKFGGEVILDAGSPRKGIRDLLPHVDHLVVSHRFSEDFAQEADPGQAALKLAWMGFRSVVITSGRRGCVAANPDGELFEQDAFKVDVIDTTGAGDIFHGGFVYGLDKAWELPKIIEYASAAAALKCTRLGGRHGIPELNEVLGFIESQKNPQPSGQQ
jgi:ribokinase